MPIDFTNFHFIRPDLLWLLIPAIALIYYIKRQAQQQSDWNKIISPQLLKFLITNQGKSKSQSSIMIITLLIALLIIIGISGPSFREKLVPVFETEQAKIFILDASLSMDATDLKPSRIERAKFKLIEMLKQTKEGSSGLIIYAGDAFVISPLTSDSNTILSMVSTLSTQIMPVLGSRADKAVMKAIELLKNAKQTKGEIIWLTDGVDEQFVDSIVSNLKQTNYRLSILAIGTEQGSPIPLANNKGFLKNNNGSIIVPKLEIEPLNQITQQTQAGLIKLTSDNSDIEYLKQHNQWINNLNQNSSEQSQKINRWVDDGYWIMWLVLLLYFIKIIKQPVNRFVQWLAPTLLIILTSNFFAQPASAFEWDDLWLTKNQQAQQAYDQKDFKKSTKLFEDPQWKAVSAYKNGDFEAAAQSFSDKDPDASISTNSAYNYATSLAKAGKLEDSLKAYNDLIKQDSTHQDALFNKKIVAELLKQQKEQQEQQNDKNNQENEEQDKQDQQNQEQQDSQQSQNSDSEQESQPSEQEEKTDEQKGSEEDTEQSAAEKQQQEENKEDVKQAGELTEEQRDKNEKDQKLKVWLEKIPDDPGGLLRRKMYREYQLRDKQQKEKKIW